VSWKEFLEWNDVLRIMKNILSLLLNRISGQQGRRWFVRDGSRRRVKDQDHLNHLLGRYLPDHRGVFWRESLPIPEDRYGILDS
jgi:hypothetical protein